MSDGKRRLRRIPPGVRALIRQRKEADAYAQKPMVREARALDAAARFHQKQERTAAIAAEPRLVKAHRPSDYSRRREPPAP